MTEPKEALKPCPFCGGDNVRVFGPYGWYRHYGISHSCRSFYSGAQELAQGFHSETEAIAAWNTRADATENAALREKLAEMEAVLRWFHSRRFALQSKFDLHGPADLAEAMRKIFTQIDTLTRGDNAEG